MASAEETIAKVTSFYADMAPYFHDWAYGNGRFEARHARLKTHLREIFRGQTVLELAAGSGHWTEAVAGTAKEILATDVHANMIESIKRRLHSLDNVRCQVASAYSLDGVEGQFTAAFAQYWYSHVPQRELQGFLDTLHSKLQPGALVLFTDELLYHIDGITRRTDEYGDIWEERPMRDGSRAETMKNFPTEQELRQAVAGMQDITYREYDAEQLWTLSYRLPS